MKTLLWVKQFYDAWGFYPMAGGTLGDGSAWDETNPVDGTLVSQIDDYDRDLRIGVRGRMALEHEWPSSQAATSQAGVHKFITLQVQAAKPTIAGTQLAAIYAKTVGAGLTEAFFENEAGTEVQLTNRSSPSGASGSVIQVVSTGLTTPVNVTAAVPQDDTNPLYSEGNVIGSLPITPSGATNKLRITANCWAGIDGAQLRLAYITTGTGSSPALAVRALVAANGLAANFPVDCIVTLSTTATQTVYFLGGVAAAGTSYVGRSYLGTDLFGTAAFGEITIEEIKA